MLSSIVDEKKGGSTLDQKHETVRARWKLDELSDSQLVRLSCAHLVTRVSCGTTTHNLAVKPGGKKEWQALGGAAQLTASGRDELATKFQASDFEVNRATSEPYARFQITASNLIAVCKWLIAAEESQLEQGPHRKFSEEIGLDDDVLGVPTFTRPVVALQPAPQSRADDTSRRGRDARLPTRRLFFQWQAKVSPECLGAMRNADHLCFLSAEELASTSGGSKSGETAAGETIANNLGL